MAQRLLTARVPALAGAALQIRRSDERPATPSASEVSLSWRYSLRYSLAPLSEAWLADYAATAGRRVGDC